MVEWVAYVTIYCHCGHSGLVGLTRMIHRDLILPRARCSVCGQRRATDVIVYAPAKGEEQRFADERVPVYRT